MRKCDKCKQMFEEDDLWFGWPFESCLCDSCEKEKQREDAIEWACVGIAVVLLIAILVIVNA